MEVSAYRGSERRRVDDVGVWGRAWILAAVTLGITLLLVIWLVLVARNEVGRPSAVASLHAAEAVLAVVVVATGLAHWRAVGRSHGLYVAVAGTLLGVVAVLDLLPSADTPVQVREGLRSGLGLTAAVWVGRAVRGPEVDTSLRAHRQFLVAGLVAVAIASVTVSLQQVGLDGQAGAGLWSLLAAAAWLGVASVGIARSIARNWGLLGWVSWAGVALGVSEVARWQTRVGDPAWEFVSGAVGATGLLVGAVGGIWALARVAMGHRGDVYGMLLQGRSQHQRDEGQRRELLHELRNALLAVEGATSTLERLGDRLTDDERRELRRILQTGMDDLRALVAEPPSGRPGHPFTLDDVVAERAAAARLRGVPVQVEGLREVRVVGDASKTGRVIGNLLLNAERHGGAGPGEPVTVSVDTRVDVAHNEVTALVRVADTGPGVPAHCRDRIFEAGYQVDPPGKGDGIGLHAARSLAVEQGGSLHHEDRPGGGACFVLSLPLAVRVLEAVSGPPADEVEDGH